MRAHTALEVLALFAEQGAKPGAKNTNDVAAEVQDYGQFSTDLDNGGEGRAGVGPNIRSPTMRICALEETGRYSVNACTSPRKIAWKKFMNPLYVFVCFPSTSVANGA